MIRCGGGSICTLRKTTDLESRDPPIDYLSYCVRRIILERHLECRLSRNATYLGMEECGMGCGDPYTNTQIEFVRGWMDGRTNCTGDIT